MGRSEYGGTADDYAVTRAGVPLAGAAVTVTLPDGTTADTTRADGTAWASGPVADTDGLVHFLGPDGYSGPLTVRLPGGPPVQLLPVRDLLTADQARALIDQTPGLLRGYVVASGAPNPPEAGPGAVIVELV